MYLVKPANTTDDDDDDGDDDDDEVLMNTILFLVFRQYTIQYNILLTF